MHKGASGHQDLGQVAMGRRGSVPGSPSPSSFCVQNSRARKSEKRRGRAWGRGYVVCSLTALSGSMSPCSHVYPANTLQVGVYVVQQDRAVRTHVVSWLT